MRATHHELTIDSYLSFGSGSISWWVSDGTIGVGLAPDAGQSQLGIDQPFGKLPEFLIAATPLQRFVYAKNVADLNCSGCVIATQLLLWPINLYIKWDHFWVCVIIIIAFPYCVVHANRKTHLKATPILKIKLYSHLYSIWPIETSPVPILTANDPTDCFCTLCGILVPRNYVEVNWGSACAALPCGICCLLWTV